MTTTTETPTCTNDWCNRPRAARGFCKPCYNRGHQASDMTRAAMRPFQISALRHEDVDEMVVERLIAGDPPEHTTIGEREAAIRQLHAAGLSDPQIGERIGVSAACVYYRRKSLGLPANWPHPKAHADA